MNTKRSAMFVMSGTLRSISNAKLLLLHLLLQLTLYTVHSEHEKYFYGLTVLYCEWCGFCYYCCCVATTTNTFRTAVLM